MPRPAWSPAVAVLWQTTLPLAKMPQVKVKPQAANLQAAKSHFILR